MSKVIETAKYDKEIKELQTQMQRLDTEFQRIQGEMQKGQQALANLRGQYAQVQGALGLRLKDYADAAGHSHPSIVAPAERQVAADAEPPKDKLSGKGKKADKSSSPDSEKGR